MKIYLIGIAAILLGCSSKDEQLSLIESRLNGIEKNLIELVKRTGTIESKTQIIADSIGTFRQTIIHAKKVKWYER